MNRSDIEQRLAAAIEEHLAHVADPAEGYCGPGPGEASMHISEQEARALLAALEVVEQAEHLQGGPCTYSEPEGWWQPAPQSFLALRTALAAFRKLVQKEEP